MDRLVCNQEESRRIQRCGTPFKFIANSLTHILDLHISIFYLIFNHYAFICLFYVLVSAKNSLIEDNQHLNEMCLSATYRETISN